MKCNLNIVLGYSPGCDADQCVYWRGASCTDRSDPGGCVLDRFDLIGRHPDNLAHWLMRYKLKHRANGTQKVFAAQRKRWLILR